MSDGLFSNDILKEFGDHATRMREAARARRQAVQLRAVVDDKEDGVAVSVWETLGVRLPNDKWQGCTNLRTLRALLSIIDDRGFERSAHQMKFHSAFERCVSRVVYKKDWATARPAIMRHNGWPRCSSEVMISTPRRFGVRRPHAWRECAAHERRVLVHRKPLASPSFARRSRSRSAPRSWSSAPPDVRAASSWSAWSSSSGCSTATT